MIYEEVSSGSRARRTLGGAARVLFALKIDGPLVVGLTLIAAYGLIVLYSASGQSVGTVVRTVLRVIFGAIAMLLLARVNPNFLRRSTPWLYAAGVLLLLIVAAIGHSGMGAQRWLDLGIFRFQPSELMKLAVPMACAWYLHDRPLPPGWLSLTALAAVILVPVALVALQPDLGTAALIAVAGALVIVLAGLRVRVMVGVLALAALAAWFGWSFMHDYQRRRVLTFLNPQTDPLGAGYHIIQSQIAIGSGGVFGKGWMNGSQAQLEFLPERSTDFIFAVVGEEFGLLGLLLLLLLYAFVVARSIYLATQTQDTFARLLAGSIALTFSVYVFINAGMVTGLLPVVGVPLPLVSYGGSSVVTLLAGFGILMALYSHRKLVGS
ncbi:MAG TPA: rod shape-determining protein RodA [Steroidobacteraceae bacterium]|jgi:rod shape determining protein RodA|nr:rod shape-determining protein RodA [Steroidobacteraceae bacterium]